jgi:hypothetical protein
LAGWLVGWLAGWLSGFTPFTSSPPHLLDFTELLFPNFRAFLFAPTSVFFPLAFEDTPQRHHHPIGFFFSLLILFFFGRWYSTAFQKNSMRNGTGLART